MNIHIETVHQASGSGRGTKPHNLRAAAGNRPAANSHTRGEAALFRLLAGHHHQRGRAVVNAGGVGRRHHAVGFKCRTQRGSFSRGVSRGCSSVANRRVAFAVRHLKSQNLLAEALLSDRLQRLLLARPGEIVHRFAGDTETLRNVFRRDAVVIRPFRR